MSSMTERQQLQFALQQSVAGVLPQTAPRGAAKTAETTMPPKVGKGKEKDVAAVEEELAAKKAATMPPKVGKGKEKDVAAEPAAKTAATMPPKGGPGYLQFALDALETLGTATLPKLTKWIESERPEVDFKPHLLKAALTKAVEKGAPPHARAGRSSRAAPLTPLFFPQAPSYRTRGATRQPKQQQPRQPKHQQPRYPSSSPAAHT